MIGANIYGGALLAELSMSPVCGVPKAQAMIIMRLILVVTLFSFGLFAAGYPEHHWEWSSWSRFLAQIGFRVFPAGSAQKDHWPDIAGQCLSFAIVLSPSLQRLLAHPFLVWLGGISFPLYLLHGSLIRSLLAWLLWGFRSSDPGAWTYILAIPVFFVVVGVLSHYWTIWIEPWFAHMTKKAEEVMCLSLSGEHKNKEEYEEELLLPNGLSH